MSKKTIGVHLRLSAVNSQIPNRVKFSLQPFPTTKPQPDLLLTGNIARNGSHINLQYILKGDLTEVVIAPPSDTPLRKDGLWTDTCFEFFLGIPNSPQYWEFNLSSAGHWNVYRFDDYRQGMETETACATLPFHVQQQADSLAISLSVDLATIIPANQPLEVAITTMIKHKDSDITYWALTHLGTEADFHRRDSFLVEI